MRRELDSRLHPWTATFRDAVLESAFAAGTLQADRHFTVLGLLSLSALHLPYLATDPARYAHQGLSVPLGLVLTRLVSLALCAGLAALAARAKSARALASCVFALGPVFALHWSYVLAFDAAAGLDVHHVSLTLVALMVPVMVLPVPLLCGVAYAAVLVGWNLAVPYYVPSLAHAVSLASHTTLLTGLLFAVVTCARWNRTRRCEWLRARQLTEREAQLELDIAARTAELATQRARLELAMEAARIGLYEWSVASGAIALDDHYHRMLGYQRGELPTEAQAWLGLVHSDDRQPDGLEGLVASLEQQSTVRREYRLRHRSGDWIWVLDTLHVVGRDAAGRPEQVVGCQVDITDRQLAKEGLAERERMLSGIVRAVPMGVGIFHQRRCTWLNERLEELTGWAPGTLVGQPSRVLYRNDEDWRRLGEELYGANGPAGAEVTMVRADGTEFDAQLYGAPLDVDRREAGWMVVIHDISGLKRIERELRESRGTLHSILEAVPMGITLNTERTILWTNRQMATMVGHPVESLADLPARDLYPSQAAYDHAGRQLYDDDGPHTVEAAMVRADGSSFDAQLFAVPLEGYRLAERAVVVVHDISEIKATERALRESEQRFESASRAGRVGVWQWWFPSRDAWWSDETYRLHGLHPGAPAPTGAHYLALVHPDDRRATEHGFRQALSSDGPVRLLYRLLPSAEQIVWVELSATSERGPDGRTVCLSGTIADVTEAQLHLCERETLITELAAKNEELERFTYTVSHDLKSPLITIRGFAGRLRQVLGQGQTESAERNLQRIEHAADRMELLLNDLLTLSRVGRITQQIERIATGALVSETLALLHGPLTAAGVVVDVQPDLPPLWGDRSRWTEVFQNLLENAIKFRGDQPDPRLLVGVRPGDDGPVFFVQDNGQGIPPAYLDRVFGLFDRLSHDDTGTGIGLALVRRIVEVHGGRVWAESKGLGQGTCVCFTAPPPVERG